MHPAINIIKLSLGFVLTVPAKGNDRRIQRKPVRFISVKTG
jgi:hypothetical protein